MTDRSARGIYWVEDKPRSGAWNMALDEALLEAAVEGSAPAMRWYQWEEPTLSLGYFQSEEEVPQEFAEAKLPVVRRLSGGGAILHDQEWTYSLTLPASHPAASQPSELYLTIHRALIGVLSTAGYNVSLRRDAPEATGLTGAFLCFSRGDDFDVVLGTRKVLGSAQRRRRGAVLQHGSLVLRASRLAPQFPGLFDLQQGSATELLPTLVLAGAAAVGELEPGELAEKGLQLAERFLEKYQTLNWGRKHPFEKSRE